MKQGRKLHESVLTFSILQDLLLVALNLPYGWIQKERHDKSSLAIRLTCLS